MGEMKTSEVSTRHIVNDNVKSDVEDRVAKGQFFIVFGSPDYGKLSIDKIAGIVKSISFEEWKIDWEIFDTPMGKILQGIIDGGGELEFFFFGEGHYLWPHSPDNGVYSKISGIYVEGKSGSKISKIFEEGVDYKDSDAILASWAETSND